jgi:hypothetical protein
VQRVSSKSLRHSESFIKVHLWLSDNGRSLLDAIYKAVWVGEHLLGGTAFRSRPVLSATSESGS